jgi:hypothetical protein
MNRKSDLSLETRSQIVFAANDVIPNRFILCSMTSKASRRFATNHKRQSENINRALRNIATQLDVASDFVFEDSAKA